MMIKEYYRPRSIAEAIKLLSKTNSRPLGGGTLLTQLKDELFSVVDLQSLGLDTIIKSANHLEIGSTVTLQGLLESPFSSSPLKRGLTLEAPLNQRNRRTIAGALITSNGRSPFATIMLALDATITVLGEDSAVHPLGDFLLSQPDILKNKLVTKIEIPLMLKLAFKIVARTPADKPIICASVAQWKSGRTRLALGGWGKTPSLAFDGTDASGIEEAARICASGASDEWASSEYRSEIAAILAKRCLESFSKGILD